jgi:two-component sensor histidine kinase/CheY-like chemotaxis protein
MDEITYKAHPASILVIDDREDNLYIISQLTEDYLPHVEMMTTTDPEEGLTMALEHLPDGILLDLKMPKINGIEMCKRLKSHERTAHIPIILITSQDTTPELRALGFEAGADDFISRSIDNAELVARIKVILRIKWAEDQLRKEKSDLKKIVRKKSDDLKTEEEERKLAEENLVEKNRLNKILMDAMPCVAFLLRPGTREIVASNKAAVEAGAVPGERCYATWGQRQDPCSWCLAPELWATGKAQHLEVETRGIVWDAHWIPVSENLYINYAFDITEKKQVEDKIKASLREKEVLLKEIHHRVKNNMAVMSSLLALQADKFDDPDVIDAFKNSQNRIRSMALVHEKLYQAKDLSKIDFHEYIDNLVMNISQLSEVRRSSISVTIRVRNILLGIDLAIPCGLIINELLTNAFKYAYPGDEKGKIRIQMQLIDNKSYELRVSDNGVGLPNHIDVQNPSTFGLQLVTLLTQQLEGTIKVNREKGTTFTITFPAQSLYY